MLVALTGENNFEIAQAEKQIVSAFAAKHGDHGVVKIDGELFDARDFSGLLQGTTLFSQASLVIIKELSKNKTAWEALSDWLDKIPDETTLVIIEPSPDKRTKTYKQLKPSFKEFTLLDNSKLITWAQTYAKKFGGELGRVEAQNLINRAGFDQWRLCAEIDKLINYDAKISLQNIELLVEPGLDGSAFELLDSAMAGDTLRVNKLITQLKTEEDPYKFFGLLASQVHSLAIVASATGKNADAIAKEAGIHPFVVRKSQSLASKLGLVKIKKIAASVANCDKQIKSTGADPWDLLAICLQRIGV